MKQAIIPLESTGQFPRLVRDYIAQRDDMSGFYDYAPDMSGIRARISKLDSLKKDCALLSQVLMDQHAKRMSDRQRENIDALRADAAYTVCTGHQLCLFTGPSYVIYKAVSIIALAERISRESGMKIVPLFWMASEDHDVDEVDHCVLFTKRISLNTDYQGPVGEMPLTGIEEALLALSEVLGASAEGKALLQTMKEAYETASDMGQAFRALLQSLFEEKGLLILDAADQRLKKSFADAMGRELSEQITQSSAAETCEMIANRGERVQALPRPVNLFYMKNGKRTRIDLADGGDFLLKDDSQVWTRKEILAELDEFPERFSPNVLFRPVYQEYILPNVAYVAGPGELSYWLELREVLHSFDMEMPVVLLRDSFIWIDERTERQLVDLGFELSDFFRPEPSLHKDFAKRQTNQDLDIHSDKLKLLSHFDELIERSRGIDKGLVKFAESERQRLEKSIDGLEKKWIRAEKKKQDTELKRISSIRNRLLPSGALAERSENFMSWMLRYGSSSIDMLFEAANPLTEGVKVMRL